MQLDTLEERLFYPSEMKDDFSKRIFMRSNFLFNHPETGSLPKEMANDDIIMGMAAKYTAIHLHHAPPSYHYLPKFQNSDFTIAQMRSSNLLVIMRKKYLFVAFFDYLPFPALKENEEDPYTLLFQKGWIKFRIN
ncbi:hypothetical protein LOAG_06762 [Loa loa]|uniref:Uncharacterized protein n=1 Tax=Loa loa TaxID=7209 RepID=A0A1S0TX94_LOALO|nr:hypothetical protein LOAG_06762 [Loa loa]EFO21726.1 hypothetical protein LOAG_06762 [Loa loa]